MVRLETSVEDATEMPSEPSDELSRPQAQRGMLRIPTAAQYGVLEMSPQAAGIFAWHDHNGFRTAVQRGLILVAFANDWWYWSEAFKEARDYVHEHRESPFDLGVFAFPPDYVIEPDVVMDLAQQQIVVARAEGRTSVDRAVAFVAEFRSREAAEQENFREFASQADALRERVEASRRRG